MTPRNLAAPRFSRVWKDVPRSLMWLPGEVDSSHLIRSPPTASDMARLGRLGFLGIAVIFHLIYGFSIFDIYFVSPIVSGMRAFSVDSAKAPAQRLVLYVGALPLPSIVELILGNMLTRLHKATVCAPTRRSSSFPIPRRALPTIPSPDHWRRSFDRACWSTALLACRTREFRPSRDRDTWL